MKSRKFLKLILIGYILVGLALIGESFLPSSSSNAQSKAVADAILEFFDHTPLSTKPVEIEGIDCSNLQEIYYVGSLVTPFIEFTPSNTTVRDYIMTSSDESIIAVLNNMYLNMLNPGEVVITIKSTVNPDTVFTTTITVVDVPIRSIKILNHPIVKVGTNVSLLAFAMPGFYDEKKIDFESSDESIAKIEGDTLIPISPGKVTITASSETSDEVIDQVEFTVKDETYINPEVDKLEIELRVNDRLVDDKEGIYPTDIGFTYILRYHFYDSSGTEVEVANPDIDLVVDSKASIVNQYSILATNKGIAEVKASLKDNPNINDTIKCDVADNEDLEELLRVVYKNRAILDVISIPITDRGRIRVSTASTRILTKTFTVENPEILQIDEDGNINPQSVGTTKVTINITYADKEFVREFDVSITGNNIVKDLHYYRMIIRKGLGHFGGYLIFGLLGGISLGMLFKRRYLGIIVASIIGAAVSFVTEMIQLFTPGRNGTLDDVAINCSGYFTGIAAVIIILLIIYLIKRIKIKGEQK